MNFKMVQLSILHIILLLTIILINCIPMESKIIKNQKSSKSNLNKKGLLSEVENSDSTGDDYDDIGYVNHNKSKKRQPKLNSPTAQEKKKKSKSTKRRIIVPTPKEDITVKAIRGFDLLKKVVQEKADQVITSSKVIQRDIKAYFSSDLEMLLLRLTRPDEECPNELDIDKLLTIVSSTSYGEIDESDDSDHIRTILHKLWGKIKEKDEKTALKAMYLLHNILRFSKLRDATRIKSLVNKMSKVWCEKTDCRYFDETTLQLKPKMKTKSTRASLKTTSTISSTGTDEDPSSTSNRGMSSGGGGGDTFVSHYGTYCLRRAKTMTSNFEELSRIGIGMKTENICTQLLRAMKLIDLLLLCKPETGQESEISVTILDIVSRDLIDLFQLYQKKCIWLLQEVEDSGNAIFEGWAEEEVTTVLSKFKEFHNHRMTDVKEFLEEAGQMMELYGVQEKLVLKSSTLL